MIAAKLLGTPVMIRAEGILTNRRRSAARSVLMKGFFLALRHFVTVVLPIGARSREYWDHYLGRDFPSFDVPYAVDNAFFRRTSRDAAATREQFRIEQGLEAGRPVILFASKLMERKRCVDLIDAFLAMDELPHDKRPYLLIVGEGEERKKLEQKCRESGTQSVRFLGFQNQSRLGRFFNLCDVFVLPSIDEPFGLIVNEVMNAGRPVVVSDQVGCQYDLVDDGVTGRVFPARDVAALRQVLHSMVADPELCRQMGAEALARISGWSYEQDVHGLKCALNHLRSMHCSSLRRRTSEPEHG
jgi:glycosyltransferase involved in cell wall biosynthesis